MSKAEPRPVYTEPGKRRALDDLASLVKDGAVVAVGGGLSSREPMALLRAILRRGTRGLTVVGSAHGIDIDLLSGGGAISRSSESYVGFEQDFGMAPNYRRGARIGRCQNGRQLLLHAGAAIAGRDPRLAIHAYAIRPRHGFSIASSRI